MTHNHNPLPEHELLMHKSFLKSLNTVDCLFALLTAAGAFFAQTRIQHTMDIYEMVILWASTGITVFLGWFFKPMRWFVPLCAVLAYSAIMLYDGEITHSDGFLLKYFLSSQSAIMWQCAFIFFALFAYIAGAVLAQRKNVATNTLLGMGSVFAWVSAVAGFTGLLVRWHESYLLRPDAGHIPVSNLYEVFILFLVITALMYLYYEARFAVQKLGGFVFSFMAIVVGFVLWYSFSREAHTIQPLIPALQSWWMKIHVPANFIGYGAFCIAAMLGIAELWAFIVWLNYAVWLHLRLVAGWRGKILAWWAVIGLFVTAFAFIGVNMFLSGLHSYGTL